MQQSLINEEVMNLLDKVTYLVGSGDIISAMPKAVPRFPFDEYCLDFLNELSKRLMTNQEAKAYPDVITLGFWIRKSSLLKLKERFGNTSNATLTNIIVGRGIAFHVAPSNVPVNYMYSLITGLLTGNVNIVRVPSKDFVQVRIINVILNEVLKEFPDMRDYICLVKYERNQEINNIFSAIADIRIIWGGDNTVKELRNSPLGPRATEVTFADRYSLAIVNSDKYMAMENKERFAEEFYNDTFLTDQNACTSPRLVVWTGSKKDEAKEIFWQYEHDLVKKKYTFQPIISINKLTSSYLMAIAQKGTCKIKQDDNYIVRVQVPKLNDKLIDLKENSGFFVEYDCDDILDLRELCNNIHCQTIGFLGEPEDMRPLILSGIKGVDRVVPIGKTMDFDMIWDGYNLYERLTRIISV